MGAMSVGMTDYIFLLSDLTGLTGDSVNHDAHVDSSPSPSDSRRPVRSLDHLDWTYIMLPHTKPGIENFNLVLKWQFLYFLKGQQAAIFVVIHQD